jgi:hypothetical protein
MQNHHVKSPCKITMQRLQEESKIKTALEDQVRVQHKPEKLADLAHCPQSFGNNN